MKLEFHGAAGEVTGSLHRLVVGDTSIGIDCGLVQGRRAESNARNRRLPAWANTAHAWLLSHAHLDHSGNLPTLVKQGFTGNIYATPATRDLCGVMLRDSAMVQEQDARYLNRKAEREGTDQHVTPLYNVADADRAINQMIALPLRRTLTVAPGVSLTFFEAGHVLGSALVCLDVEEAGRRRRLLFTGDLGREELPLLNPPEHVPGVNVLLTESTYGDRLHGPLSALDDTLAQVVTRTVKRGGRVFIPAFALERAQEVLFALSRLLAAKQMPAVPIYIDSPLAIAITEIYKLHPESLDPALRQRLSGDDDPFAPPGLHYVSTADQSRALQSSGKPCIIIAGSGMCEGGRILHHLNHGLGDARNTVAIVGFQAQHTLGRRLAERRSTVRVFGMERDVRAEVVLLDGLSAHADQAGLVAFAQACRQAGELSQVALVHGEPEAAQGLSQALQAQGFGNVVVASPGAGIEL
ncbi:MAG: MBL fold metallo-hydrolase [Deltaproteobacteria bacterium]|nr:MBL fold metallo-hydrolase [Deltaproteobacteria bacterium]